MYIVYFFLGAIFLLSAIFLSVSTTVTTVCFILAIVFFLMGAGKVISQKLGQQSRAEHLMISPEELRRIKEGAKKTPPVDAEDQT